MEQQPKTITISYEKQSIEITINESLSTFSSFQSLLQSEFSLSKSFSIFTSDTNTLINEQNYATIILSSDDTLIEIYITLDNTDPFLDDTSIQNHIDTLISTNKNDTSSQNDEVIHFPSDKDNIDSDIMRTGIILEKQFPNDKCSICEDTLNQIKYVCAICENCILCEECELKHEHPVIRFKAPFLSSSKKEVMSLIKVCSKENYSGKAPLLSYYIYLTNDLYENKICLGVHVKKEFNVKIHNKSQNVLPKGAYRLIAKDYGDMEVKFESELKEEMQPKDKKDIKVTICGGKKEGTFEMYFYFLTSVEKKLFKVYSCPMKIKVKVINDEEEIMLSGFFTEYPEIQVLPKELMKMIYDVINDKISTKAPNEVCAILKKHKWNIQKAIEELTTS